ncbi:site-specific DNA-methyltransferase [Candidatus Marinimicrobia bacterium]|nr:site-specific DNA-methyltransferase [Candidatus Neomarinimicrobiota bacterium]
MKLYKILENTLKKEPNFLTDTGELKKWVVLNKAKQYDKYVLKLLLSEDDLKEQFFIAIEDTLVFNLNKFSYFLEQKNYLNDSFTKYKNKIGLSDNGKHLIDQNEVSLVWPYKDCILEGGQSFDDEEREEIFFNKILAQDEINQLTESKVLSNAKRYSAKSIDNIDKIKRLKNGQIDENIIIKGNNLLTIHSLKSEYAGKLDLIYIDPPYNTGGNGDTFRYNNKFKRSTWLTFVKNRLEIAKKLLKKDGALIVAIDENEQVHLGVLLKEMFKNHEVHCITIVHNPRGIQGTNFSYTHEYAFFVIPESKKSISNQIIEQDEIKFRGLRDNGGESLRTDAKNCFYPFIINPEENKIVGFGDVCPDDFHIAKRNVKVDDLIYIYPVDNDGVERKWRYANQSASNVLHLMRVVNVKGVYDIQLGKNFRQYKTVWTGARYDSNEYGTKLLKSLVPDSKFSFPKSLWNVYDCLYAVVGDNKEALILDYHAGSGTTAHAVVEMNKRDDGNRKFIMCEQMDYIETETCLRLKNLIKKDKLDYDFLYFELKKYNQTFIELIEEAKDTNNLIAIWEQMKEKSFLNYNIDIQVQDENIEEFKSLELSQQKELLVELLDKNQMYVNLSSMDDEDFEITEEEKKITKEFYSINRN